MAYGIPRNLESQYNVLTVPNYVKDLVVTASPGTIHAAYTAPPGVEAWTVFRPSAEGVPVHPFDGWRVVTPLAEDAETTVAVNLTEGVVNGTEYVVRVFIRGELGFQTRVGGAVARATPRAGQPASVFPVGTILAIPMADGSIQRRIIVQQGLPAAMYDGTCDNTWTLEEAIHEKRKWHSSNSNSYKASTIHAYLNGGYANLFDPRFLAKVVEAKIPYVNGTGNSAVVSGANGLLCKFFLLSGCEMGYAHSSEYQYLPNDGKKLSYFDNGNDLAAASKRIAYFNGTATRWWMRSPYTWSSEEVWGITEEGYINGRHPCSSSYGVRPACILPSDMLFSLEPNADGSYSPIL